MERRNFLTRLGISAFTIFSAMPFLSKGMKNKNGNMDSCALNKGEIQHLVLFDLNHEKGSAMAEKFLKDGQTILSNLPVVQNFQVLNQVSLKNDFAYGFSMVFAAQSAYTTYNNHPDHQAFVENRWKKEVKRFLEIDFIPH